MIAVQEEQGTTTGRKRQCGEQRFRPEEEECESKARKDRQKHVPGRSEYELQTQEVHHPGHPEIETDNRCRLRDDDGPHGSAKQDQKDGKVEWKAGQMLCVWFYDRLERTRGPIGIDEQLTVLDEILRCNSVVGRIWRKSLGSDPGRYRNEQRSNKDAGFEALQEHSLGRSRGLLPS